MPYKYNSEKNILEEMPEMKEPEFDEVLHNSSGDTYLAKYSYLYEDYKKHIASLKTYPVFGNCNWVDGQILEEGHDWKKVNVCEDGQRCECNNSEAQRCLYSNFIAIPIEENKEEDAIEHLRNVTIAANRMRDNWAEGDQNVKNDLWKDLHTKADAAREFLNSLK